MTKMTDRQLEFFRALCGPFTEAQCTKGSKGGRNFTYIKKSAIENRLDEVAGPDGWRPEYIETKSGFTCRLHILVPGQTADGFTWLAKEDGGGSEGMGQKNRDGQWEEDTDNDAKSAYTNAFRRAAQAPWGIGRGYYDQGIPDWMMVSGAPASPPPRDSVMVTPSAGQPGQYGQETGRGNSDRQYSFGQLPKSGRALFAWSKKMEEHFQTTVTNGLIGKCKQLTGQQKLDLLSEDQIGTLVAEVMTFLKTLPSYKGEFDGVKPPEPFQPDFGQPAKSNLELKQQIHSLAATLHKAQFGTPGTVDDLGAAVKDVARGVNGTILQSLNACEDRALLLSMTDELNRLIALAQRPAPKSIPADDIPF